MNQNSEKLFKQIINNPKIIASLPKTLISNIDFIEKYYIILKDEIKPYIPKETYETLKHREIIFKNKYKTQLEKRPSITLKSELEILHDILSDPKTIETLPTDEKYNNSFLEFVYLIWGDEIEPYIPYEMFEELKNTKLMQEYHQNHNQGQEDWVNEENQKIKLLSKR